MGLRFPHRRGRGPGSRQRANGIGVPRHLVDDGGVYVEEIICIPPPHNLCVLPIGDIPPEIRGIMGGMPYDQSPPTLSLVPPYPDSISDQMAKLRSNLARTKMLLKRTDRLVEALSGELANCRRQLDEI